MTISHSSKSYSRWDYNHQDTDNISTPADKKNLIYSQQWTNGSGDDQINDMYIIEDTVQPGSDNVKTYDLAGGVTDRFGNVITLSAIKKILLKNTSTTKGADIRIGGPTTGSTGNLITSIFGAIDGGQQVRASGKFDIEAPLDGWAITAGTADILVISNEYTAAITYQLLIGGIR